MDEPSRGWSKKFQKLTTVDSERSERKIRKENKKKTTETMANLTPDNRDAKRSTVKQTGIFSTHI